MYGLKTQNHETYLKGRCGLKGLGNEAKGVVLWSGPWMKRSVWRQGYVLNKNDEVLRPNLLTELDNLKELECERYREEL